MLLHFLSLPVFAWLFETETKEPLAVSGVRPKTDPSETSDGLQLALQLLRHRRGGAHQLSVPR